MRLRFKEGLVKVDSDTLRRLNGALTQFRDELEPRDDHRPPS